MELNMLKKSIIIFTVINLFLSCASFEKVDNPTAEIVEIVEVDLAKEKIYNLSLQFIAENFRSAKAVIEYQDRETGRIIGNGSTTVSDGLMNRPATFTMIIDVKDNKYRITYKSLMYQPGTAMPWKPIDYAVPYKHMKTQLDSLTIRLKKYISTASTVSDF